MLRQVIPRWTALPLWRCGMRTPRRWSVSTSATVTSVCTTRRIVRATSLSPNTSEHQWHHQGKTMRVKAHLIHRVAKALAVAYPDLYPQADEHILLDRILWARYLSPAA